MPQPTHDIQTVAFVSLGCPKNLVDSEKMLGLLAEDGIIPVPADDAAAGGADAVVVNTCGFLEASKDESLGEIERAAQLKRAGKLKRLVVAGCLVQRHRAKMLEWCPDIDALIGVFDRDHIVDAVRPRKLDPRADVAVELPVYSSIAANATLAKQARRIEAEGYFEDDSARLRLTPRHYAYLRISEGCNQNCTFCTIPSIRGKMRSKHPDAIVRELKELLADGAFEINLIGQDTTSYGQDVGYEPGLVGLLQTLNDTVKTSGGGGWLRLMYAYPSCFTDAMIDAIARLPHVVKYIDMPLQHINGRVLERMRRHTSRELIETLLAKLRKRIAGIAIRTTFISGFPGETEDEHRELVEFVASGGGFEAMGVFPYSPEPGTPAGSLHQNGEAVEPDVIERRIDELMRAQQRVVFARHQKLADEGVEFDVLIDRAADDGGVGRTAQQAPDIDGLTRVHTAQRLAPGELVRCRVTGFDGYDLVARPVEEIDGRVSLSVVR